MKKLIQTTLLTLIMSITTMTWADNSPYVPGYDNRDLATAILSGLINYEAQAKLRAYYLHQSELFMPAPGTLIAVNAGTSLTPLMLTQALAKDNNNTIAPQDQLLQSNINRTSLNLSNQGLVYTVGLISGAPSFLLNGKTIINPNSPGNANIKSSSNRLYDKISGFFNNSGNTTNFGLVNPAEIMQTDKLSNTQLSLVQKPMTVTDPKYSYEPNLLSILINPFPTDLAGIQTKLNTSNPQLTGKEIEGLVQGLADGALYSLSMNTISDIVARRLPGGVVSNSSNKSDTDAYVVDMSKLPTDTPDSQMQIMARYSNSRFRNSEWYNDMSAATEPALLREIAHMMAYNQFMQYQQYRLMEQQTALLATINSILTRMNSSIVSLSAQVQDFKTSSDNALSAAQSQQQLDKLNPTK